MDTTTDNFGLRLRSLIERRRLTVDAFADEYGIARSTAHLWLNRAAPPLEKHWKPLADFFGVSEKYLAYGVPVAEEEQSDYAKLREGGPRPAPPAGRESEEMLNPRFQPAASDSPTLENCASYFAEFLRRAKSAPGAAGWTWRQLQKHFPLDEFEGGEDHP